MQRGDRRLKLVLTRTPQPRGAIERFQPVADLRVVPGIAVLMVERDVAALRVDAGGAPTWLDPSTRGTPYGTLPPALRGMDALVLPGPGEAVERARTPIDDGGERRRITVRAVLDAAGSERAVVLGISEGGSMSALFAATHPERVTALVLASTPGPGWTPNAAQARYIGAPWRTFPEFCVTAAGRLGGELVRALPDWPSRIGFTLGQLVNVVSAPAIPGLMAQRVRLMQQTSVAPDCARITVPTLVITGADDLDRVVPVSSSKEYLRLIPHAKYAVMPDTGHLGSLMQPARFAGIVKEFLASHR
jgi:pimeloyl-ACP methyl ester carboxylesterase